MDKNCKLYEIIMVDKIYIIYKCIFSGRGRNSQCVFCMKERINRNSHKVNKYHRKWFK